MEVQVFETFDDMSKSAQRTFFEHFSADDWSYLVVSESREAAMARAKELHPHACDTQFAEIDNETWVVTYHS